MMTGDRDQGSPFNEVQTPLLCMGVSQVSMSSNKVDISSSKEVAIADIAVVISSCDKYSDLWKPFFTLFFRYWSDCPFHVYLIANHLRYADPRVTIINTGDDHDWSSSFRKAIRNIPTRYLIMLLDDYFLFAEVNTDKVIEYAQYVMAKNAAFLQLYSIILHAEPSDNHPEIGPRGKGSLYRISTQPAIWDKQAVDMLLQDGESIWEFETKGTVRSNSLDMPFLGLKLGVKSPIPVYNATYRGKLVQSAIRLCKRENVPIDLNARTRRTILEEAYYYVFYNRWGEFYLRHASTIGSVKRLISRQRV
jgi:hypothetical protein